MCKFNGFSRLALVLVLMTGLQTPAHSEPSKALTSKAAIKFYDILAGYLLGKALDTIYAKSTAPDPKELDKALNEIQDKHPEYTMMLGTLRRSVKTDGSPTTRAEFESLAKDLVWQMEHSQLNAGAKQTPSIKITDPKTTSITDFMVGTKLYSDPFAIRSPSRFSDGLRNSLRFEAPPLLPMIKYEEVLAAKMVGAWSFSHKTNLDPGGDVYIFHRNGKVTNFKVIGREEIFSFQGTYTVEGKKLTLRWELPNGMADVITAQIEEIDGGHLNYTPEKGIFDQSQPATKRLTRVSDVGDASVVTLSNPTDRVLVFQTRWATVNGTWTNWENVTFQPGDMWSISRPGGFFCQIGFDKTLAEGIVDKVYELPFNVVSSPNAPNILDEGTYRIKIENDEVDLVSERLSLSGPAPGVR